MVGIAVGLEVELGPKQLAGAEAEPNLAILTVLLQVGQPLLERAQAPRLLVALVAGGHLPQLLLQALDPALEVLGLKFLEFLDGADLASH